MSIELSYTVHELKFIHPFSVAGNTRSYTPMIIVKLICDNLEGYGEINMPPYLGETKDSAINFLNHARELSLSLEMSFETFHELIDSISEGNNAAKAGLDIAFHDLKAKFNSTDIKTLYQLPECNKQSSFTIGLDTPDIMVDKTKEALALDFKVLKVKLGGSQDEACIRQIAKIWKGPISVDANQGWKDKDWSLDFCFELKELGVQFVEQPFEKSNLNTAEWLTSRSPLPIIADESCKRFKDLEVVKNCFHGINVKLMKSTGLYEAFNMLQFAKNNRMKTVTGCMAESSCAVAAMSHFGVLADWVDLDGPFLITNDPFESVNLVDGCIKVPREIGIGVNLR
jgi:L-alanine-DL-glutamate epimerase-like enolase superfamily enzyme